MAESVKKADHQDALDIGEVKIVMDGEELGYISGLTVDGKSPEDLISVFGGTIRRKKPRTVSWSADAVALYGNLDTLDKLRKGALFQIVVDASNPDTQNASNLGFELTVQDCRVSDHSIQLGESSTYRMSGNAKDWFIKSK